MRLEGRMLPARERVGATALGLFGTLALLGSAPFIGQTATPIEGQPIAFAADHDGTCAPSTLTDCTVSYQLYVNGVKIGAETPISSTPGVVKVTISGLSAGAHSARITAIARGKDPKTGVAVTSESDKSAALTFTVLAAGPGPAPTVGQPVNLRVSWPEPPPDLEDELIVGQSNWVVENSTADLTAEVQVMMQAGQTVLLTSFQPGSASRLYTASASNSMPLTLYGTAWMSGSSRGVIVWMGQAKVTGSVTLAVKANITSNFRISALTLNALGFDPKPWIEVETTDSTDHACGPSPWPTEHDGRILCMAVVNAGTGFKLINADWIPPTTGSILGGWMTRSAGEEQDGQIQFRTGDARRANKIALRIW